METPNEEKLNHNIIPITGLYENWFLDYASYVILDRAVPNMYDGLKPVQRRILHYRIRLKLLQINSKRLLVQLKVKG
jgi:DNA gyrase/topoisomerase IV subunit A